MAGKPSISAEAKRLKKYHFKQCKRYEAAVAILGRIKNNEATGKIHPKDAADKIRFQTVVDEHRAYLADRARKKKEEKDREPAKQVANGQNGVRKPSALSKLKKYQAAVVMLGKISKNEAAGRVHPKDAKDKIRSQKVIDKYQVYLADCVREKTEEKNRKRILFEARREAAKKRKISRAARARASTTKPTTSANCDVVNDNLQVALMDAITNCGKPILDK